MGSPTRQPDHLAAALRKALRDERDAALRQWLRAMLRDERPARRTRPRATPGRKVTT